MGEAIRDSAVARDIAALTTVPQHVLQRIWGELLSGTKNEVPDATGTIYPRKGTMMRDMVTTGATPSDTTAHRSSVANTAECSAYYRSATPNCCKHEPLTRVTV